MTGPTLPTQLSPAHRVILLATRSRMQRELLGRALKRMDRSTVVVEMEDGDTLPILCRRLQPDWVVISLKKDGTVPETVDELATVFTDLSLLALSENGDTVKARIPGETAANDSRWRTYSQLRLAELFHLMESRMEDGMEHIEKTQAA